MLVVSKYLLTLYISFSSQNIQVVTVDGFDNEKHCEIAGERLAVKYTEKLEAMSAERSSSKNGNNIEIEWDCTSLFKETENLFEK